MSPELSLTLVDLLRDRAAAHPDRPFVEVLGERCESYAEIQAAAARVAGGLLRLGVAAGEPVVVMAQNSLAAIHCWFGINMAGAIEVAINTAYRGGPLAHAVRAVDAKWIILEAPFLAHLAAVEDAVPGLVGAIVIGEGGVQLKRVPVVPYAQALTGAAAPAVAARASDVASVIYTSGTSGPAKPVLLTHSANLNAAGQAVRGLRLQADDVYYCAHPLFHMAGKSLAVIAQLLAGGMVVLDGKFAASEWIHRIAATGATVTVAHGPMLEMIHAQPATEKDRGTRLRRVLACPLPKRIATAFEERFATLGIEAYGMTEIGLPAIRPMDEPLRVGCCGRIDRSRYDLRIADADTDAELPAGAVGQILVRPKQDWVLMQGYAGMPESTVAAWRNLWFHTGDAGFVDEDDHLHFVDRLGDRIRRRAESISSYDIEVAALAFPGVSEAAAVGVPSEFESDDDIKLCVVAQEDHAPDPRELLGHLAARLPHYMVPRFLEVLDALPRTPTNKVRKAALRAAGITAGTWDRKAHGVELRELIQHG